MSVNFPNPKHFAEVSASCKFCKNPLILQVHLSFNRHKDKLGIIGMAACNRCGDMMETRRDLRRRLGLICGALISYRDEETKKKLEGPVTGLCKRYVRMVSEYYDLPALPFHEEMVSDIVDNPKVWTKVLAGIWAEARELQRQEKPLI